MPDPVPAPLPRKFLSYQFMQMKASHVNALYFVQLAVMTVLCVWAILYPIPPWLLENVTGSWEWSDMPTPRLIRCITVVLMSFAGHCAVHFVCRCVFRLFFDRYYTLPYPSRVTLSEK